MSGTTALDTFDWRAEWAVIEPLFRLLEPSTRTAIVCRAPSIYDSAAATHTRRTIRPAAHNTNVARALEQHGLVDADGRIFLTEPRRPINPRWTRSAYGHLTQVDAPDLDAWLSRAPSDDTLAAGRADLANASGPHDQSGTAAAANATGAYRSLARGLRVHGCETTPWAAPVPEPSPAAWSTGHPCEIRWIGCRGGLQALRAAAAMGKRPVVPHRCPRHGSRVRGRVIGPGRPKDASKPLAHAYIIGMFSEFQGFVRDLHDLAVERVVSASGAGPTFAPILIDGMTAGRGIDRGNATTPTMKSDFARIELSPLNLALHNGRWSKGDSVEFDLLVRLRNALRHGNESELRALLAGGAVKDTVSWARARLPLLNRYVRALDKLV